jgi:DNA-binding beta-propeller fold protein YncE
MRAKLLICASFLSSLLFPLNTLAQATSADHSNVQIENWAKPVSGWLYVLDPQPDAVGAGGRIWLVDPESGNVMGSIRTGDHADFALSPDGSRLYVASTTEGDSSELAVIDTVQGEVVERASIKDRAVSDGLPPFSTMAVSGDGLALRILIDTPKSEDADAFMLAALDTRTGDFLKRVVYLGNCGPGRFISYPAADQFDFFCPRTNRIRLIRVDGEAQQLQNQDVMLPWERREGVGAAVELPGSQDVAIVRGDGGIFTMDLATQRFSDTAAHPALANRVPPAAWPSSPDGSKVYVGYKNEYRREDNRFYLDYGRPPNIRPDNERANEFHVFDTNSWRKIGTIRMKLQFWSAVATNDGKLIYATAPWKHSILVIDTAKMRETGIIKVKGTPALVAVEP